MAYNANNEERRELCTIVKNSRGETIKGAEITNKNTGTVSIDIRQFYTTDSDEVAPTSKGVRFNAENLYDLILGLCEGLEDNEKQELAEELLQGLDDIEEEDDMTEQEEDLVENSEDFDE
jgi:transcriptional coactivator p15 (PC4)|nr:MAG TPA: Transcriptional Coactivator p15 (PC4) [Caudoviricetes sp.]